MKKIFFFIPIFFTFSGCNEEEQITLKIDNGIYEGTFQREIISSENETAKITLFFHQINGAEPVNLLNTQPYVMVPTL